LILFERRFMADPPLQGYYLTRVYREGSGPFDVVTDKPRAEAVALCSKFASHRQVAGHPGDQEAYMDGRIETENWLRTSAQAVGVDIRRDNPIYFTLQKYPHRDEDLKPGKKAISIPVEEVDLSTCSFTYGDSVGNRTSTSREGPGPLDGVVMNATQIAKLLETTKVDGDYFKGGRYIEAQMWETPAPESASTAAKPAVKTSSSLKL
jgi:hypothetical protein